MAKLNGITKVLNKSKVFFKKNSPFILVTTGVGLMVAGTVVACKETMKVEEIVDTHLEYKEKIETLVADKTEVPTEDGEVIVYDEEYGKKCKRKLTALTIFKLVKNYAPAALLLIAGGLCIFKGVNILNGRLADTTAALAASTGAFSKYREYIRGTENGEQLDRDAISGKSIVKEISEAVDDNGNLNVSEKDRTLFSPNSDTAVLFDETSTRMWNRNGAINHTNIVNVIEMANLKLKTRGYLFLYEIYEALGLDRTPTSQNMGWMLDSWNKECPWTDVSNIRCTVNGVDVMSEGLDLYDHDMEGWWLDFNCPGVITAWL